MNARTAKRKSKHEMAEMIVSSLILQRYCDGRVAIEREILSALGICHALQLVP